jgi:hypothetical protein
MVCPGSVALIKKAPPQKDSPYANEGSDAHELAQLCLTNNKKPADYAGERMKYGTEVSDEMIEAVSLYIDTIESYCQTAKFIRLYEVMFDLSILYPGLYGTADCVLISSDMKRLIVMDFKYGAGVPVEVYENKQLLYYVLGAICHGHVKGWFDNPMVFGYHQTLEEVEVCVVQPRCRHKEGPVRSWSIMSPLLDEFAEELKKAAIETEKKDALLQAGDHCKFCPAMAICPAIGREMDLAAQNSFTVIQQGGSPTLPRPEELSLDQLARIVSKSELITDWLKAVNAYAEDLAIHGEVLPGFKLVMRTGHRKWIDESAVEDRVSMVVDTEALYVKKLKSPAQIETLLGKKNKELIADLYETPELGPTLVPEHDKRPAISMGIGFEPIETKPTKGD